MTPRRRRALAGVLLCNVLEWYDFIIYGMLAIHISRVFFPQDGTQAALLATLAVFGISFVMRPLGALVLGGLGDGRGRKPALLLAAALMAAGTLTIGLLPGYERLGLLAPLLLLAARMVQGFSAGGEWGVANAFLLETAPQGRRGFSASFLSVTVALGSMLASALTAFLAGTLTPEAMAAWGWRVPFLIGGTLGLVALWLRSGIDETPVFLSGGAPPARAAPLLQRVRRPGLTVIGLTLHWTVCYYIFLVYFPLFAQRHGGLGTAQAVWSNTLATAAIVLIVPLVGHLSDRYGRRPFLMASCLAVLAAVVPVLWSVETVGGLPLVIGGQLLLAGAIALYSGACPAAVAELFATGDRSRWSAVAYALATAIFGGFAPFVAVWLSDTLGSPLAPAGYVMLAAAVSFAVIWRMPETAGRPLG
ncbi:MFS transporter [Starkeya koreensis]|uniref:MFS transporter n=1 Tax=Ancylobacter koreensis TaxID=266121 RepID=A0ABT0DKA2_9HYPH|nr:MFS transporter [Ancylobacter koreensis]MCK0207716.1 MFS transporter [Ancylobacter koreensis]